MITIRDATVVSHKLSKRFVNIYILNSGIHHLIVIG